MSMNGLELFLLGRKLAKMGIETIPSSALNEFPPSAQAVLIDVLEYPNSSIGEIAKRTELPQSQVSAAATILEERCLLETVSDPNDGRRTLVRGAPGVGRKIRKKVDINQPDDCRCPREHGPERSVSSTGSAGILVTAADASRIEVERRERELRHSRPGKCDVRP